MFDWEEASTISAHTHNYLDENEREISNFVDSLLSRVSAGGNGKLAIDRVHFFVPFGRNEDFVGRESLLEKLLATVPPDVEAEQYQKTAVVGLGGVGKTQIALEPACLVRKKYPDCSIFWVLAIDDVSYRNAYREIGELLKIDGIKDDKADVEELVKKAIENKKAGSWLLIIDNVDSPGQFGGFKKLASRLRFSRQGCLLFASRNREITVQLGVSKSKILTSGP